MLYLSHIYCNDPVGYRAEKLSGSAILEIIQMIKVHTLHVRNNL
jgi:hypothetical protein